MQLGVWKTFRHYNKTSTACPPPTGTHSTDSNPFRMNEIMVCYIPLHI